MLYGSLESTIEKGVEQTWEYMDRCGAGEGYLLIFNRTKKKSWKDKLFKKVKTFKDTKICVYECKLKQLGDIFAWPECHEVKPTWLNDVPFQNYQVI